MVGRVENETSRPVLTFLVRITREAGGRVGGTVERVPNPQAEGNPATAHMFIINPLNGSGVDNLFSTHPSTENRVAALLQMSGSMPRPQPAYAPASPMPVRPAGTGAGSVPSSGRARRFSPWGRR